MNCANHPEVTASAFCRECGKPMCPECQQPALGSVYCTEHLPVQAAPPPKAESAPFIRIPPIRVSIGSESPYTAPLPTTHVVDPGAHPLLALLLGFIPGVGAIYNGQYAKGLVHAVVFGILVSTETTNMPQGLHALVGIMIAAWVFYQAFEAFHTARKRRYGQAVEEFSSILDIRPTPGRFPVGAILLIGLGFILLLDTTDIISFAVLARYWPALLIVFGLYMLYNRLGPDHHSAVAPSSGNTTPEGGARR